MIEQAGIVVSVQGDTAEVEAERRGDCGGCAADGSCGTSLLARYFEGKRSLLQVHNAIGAAPGDRVVVGVPEGTLLEASFLAYLVPLLSLIGTAMIGAQVADYVAPAYSEGLSALAGLGGLAAALAWLAGVGRAKSLDEHYRPRILRRTGRVGRSFAVHLQPPDPPAKQRMGST
jgi:sigma-E factor negative regulatory protein RseC